MSRRNFILYYLLFLIILVSWNNPNALPPLPLRILYLIGLLYPVVKNRSEYAPIVLLTFIVISTASYAVSYMPVDGLFVTLIIITCLVIGRPRSAIGIKIPGYIYALFVLMLFIDGLLSSRQYGSLSFLIYILISRKYLNPNNDNLQHLIAFSLVIISVVLALEFIVMGNQFVIQINADGMDFDRKGWADPNYFGCEIGLGVMAALLELFTNNSLSKELKYILYASIALISFVIITTASRGAFLALSIATVIMIVFSKVKSSVKSMAVVAISFLAAFLLYTNVAALLIARFNTNVEEMGGRTDIWQIKLSTFMKTANPIEWLVGIGRDGGDNIGFFEGFHNDYAAFFVDYGILGVLLFLMMLANPFLKSSRSMRGIVLSLVSYVALVCFSLEPFTSGYLAYFYFYLLIWIVVQNNSVVYNEQKYE